MMPSNLKNLCRAGLCLLALHTTAGAVTAGGPSGETVERNIRPVAVTGKTLHDTDDPAIWINHARPEKSLILGTDKNCDGALYVFDLQGHVLEDKLIRHLRRPNNVDVEYGFSLGGRRIDIAVVTERLAHRLRIFRLPDMAPIDNGGIEVFVGEPGEDFRSPMGIALYKRPDDGAVFAIVSRKHGPKEGYLWQYRLEDDGRGGIRGELVRKFGAFHGTKEIEAIAVDDALGYVYYSDEDTGIRQYYADPRKGDEELALFGTEGFEGDREGIAIYPIDRSRGYIIVSDQTANRFHIYRREGGPWNPYGHELVKTVYTASHQCDGCDASSFSFGDRYPHGLFVAMSDNQTFQYYRWEDLAGSDLRLNEGKPDRP